MYFAQASKQARKKAFYVFSVFPSVSRNHSFKGCDHQMILSFQETFKRFGLNSCVKTL